MSENDSPPPDVITDEFYTNEYSDIANRRNLRIKVLSTESHIQDRERPVEDNIMLLKQAFFNEIREGYPGLDRPKFKAIMKTTIGNTMSFDDIDMLFTKVDVDAKGYLTWYTFLDYFAQEYQEKDRMFTNLAGKPFPHGVQEYESKRPDAIVSVCFMPVMQQGVQNYKRGRYVTVTSDGFISIWSMSVRFLASHVIETSSDLLTPMLVYDMVYVPSLNLVAVSTSVREIVMFEIPLSNSISKSYHLKGLDHSAMCMDFCQPSTERAILMWGDMCGNVFGIEFDMQTAGFFGLAKTNQKNEPVRVSYAELQKGAYLGTKLYSLLYLHNDWVTAVKYIKENDIFISCCQDENTCMYLGDLEEKTTCYYFNMRKGANAFDYSPELNVIAAGGMDYCIRVWNPYVRSDATIIFKGFSQPVTHVTINGKRGDVIGLDKGNTVRIYNLNDQVLLQIISSRYVSSSRLAVSSMYFNPVLQLVVLGTSRLSVLRRTLYDDDRLVEHYSHNVPVRLLCYSDVYEEVISACEQSTINIWNIQTGAIVNQIANAHTRVEMGRRIPMELTSMALDKTGRCLITAGRNGNVKIWNYSNGLVLHSLNLPEPNAITGILHVSDQIFVCGWNRQVGIFIETAGSDQYKTFKSAHKDEILSMVHISANIIATASYDGDIVIWKLDKGSVICRLHYLAEVERERQLRNPKHKLRANSLRAKQDNRWTGGISEEIKKRNKLPKISNSNIVSQPNPHGQPCPLNSKPKRTKKKKKPRHGYSIETMLLLKNRPFDKSTANLLAAGASGWVRAWSVDKFGGHLLGQFNPVRNAGEHTCALAVDCECKYLITGDSQGYIAIWDIRYFCISDAASAKMQEQFPNYNEIQRDKFSYLQRSKQSQKLHDARNEQRQSKCAAHDGGDAEFFRTTPPLLSVHQGHIRGINALLYIDKYYLIISASSDCSVRVWSLFGAYCGTFGQHVWSKLKPGGTLKPVKVSCELKRVASASTLKILNTGRTTHWDHAMLAMRIMGRLECRRVDDYEPITILPKPTQILGKFYQSKVRHRMMPTLPKLFEFYNAVCVWHTIKFGEMRSTAMFRNLVLMALSKEQQTRILSREQSVVVTKKAKTRSTSPRRSFKVDKVKHTKVKSTQERIRLGYQNARSGVERIDVDCRLGTGRRGQATEPIIVI